MEINYARQDVRATLGLLNALKHEYELHPISLRPDRAYSPASIGKAYLRAMGIVEPMKKFKVYPQDSRDRNGGILWWTSGVPDSTLARAGSAGRSNERVSHCGRVTRYLECTDGVTAHN